MGIPGAITRTIAKSTLRLNGNAPALLFGTGVAGMVGSTVLACRATLKLQTKLEKAREDLEGLREADADPNNSYEVNRRDRAIIITRTGIAVGTDYLPAVALGAFGIACLTKSHHILTERNGALVAAYTAVDQAFKQYRGRVVEKYGVEEDAEFRHGVREMRVRDPETKETTAVYTVPDDHKPTVYARFFDQLSGVWSKEPEYNLVWLDQQQTYFNQLLITRGHVFLNEVYDALDLPRSRAGSIVGWVLDDENRGDHYIDFGIWAGDSKKRDFVNGREGAILLDFNVDGIIYDKIKDPGERIKWQR